MMPADPASMTLLAVASVLALAVGGALGAVTRSALLRRLPVRGLLTANTLAALVAGFAAGLPAAHLVTAWNVGWASPGAFGLLLAGAAVGGFCLALGTWSTVAVAAADELLARRPAAAARLWATHLGCAVAAAGVGWGVGYALFLGVTLRP